jgi:Ala-tRNA(Pro) deacylase
VAERLAGSVAGTVLPFAFHPDLELIADPAVLGGDQVFFNAALLERSMALATEDWQARGSRRFVHPNPTRRPRTTAGPSTDCAVDDRRRWRHTDRGLTPVAL